MLSNMVKADYLGVTHPLHAGGAVRASIKPILESVGCVPDYQGYATPGGGSIRVQDRGLVAVLGVSGAALETLRAHGAFLDFLMALGTEEHRVTRLHACCDEIRDDAPEVLRALYERAKTGVVRLSRKAIKPAHVYSFFSPNSAGQDTGTVYLGRPTAEVRCKVYDKAHERLQRASVVIPPTVRTELDVRSKFNLSLRDVSNPAPVFYHFVSPDLLPRPDGIPDWVPGGVGFELEPRETRLPAEQLKRLVETSPDIRRAVRLAEQIGTKGHEYLCALLKAGCVPRKTTKH